MNGQRDDMKLKLAWQTAYELRTCPDSDSLQTSVPDENQKRHLEICHVCRDKREMLENERVAWKSLREKFSALIMKPGSGTEKQAGQVWTIKREFGGWREDGRFIRPPCVMLLEKIEGTSGWRVTQLYSDRLLMGSGDVELEDCYGFAEAWNCYSMKDDRLDVCLGGVKPDELAQVIAASARVHEPAPEGSILSFFRRMEIEVGAFVAVPAVVELVEEWEAASLPETINNFLERIVGTIDNVYARLKKYFVQGIPDTVFDLLWCVRDPSAAPQLSMASSRESVLVNVVTKQPDGKLNIDTSFASIIDYGWQDGNYLLDGKLEEGYPSNLHLLASLVYNGETIAECINQLSTGSPFFSIYFENVPKEACIRENVKFLLVIP